MPIITLHRTMDEHSQDIRRENCHIGFLQWNEGREPHVELDGSENSRYLTIRDMQKLLREYEDLKTPMLHGMAPEDSPDAAR